MAPLHSSLSPITPLPFSGAQWRAYCELKASRRAAVEGFQPLRHAHTLRACLLAWQTVVAEEARMQAVVGRLQHGTAVRCLQTWQVRWHCCILALDLGAGLGGHQPTSFLTGPLMRNSPAGGLLNISLLSAGCCTATPPAAGAHAAGRGPPHAPHLRSRPGGVAGLGGGAAQQGRAPGGGGPALAQRAPGFSL